MIDFRKTSHILFFAAVLPALSLSAGWACAQLIPNAPFWIETLSPLAAYGLFYSVFDRFIWHWPLFRWAGIVTTPDLRGRWLGEQISSFRDSNGKNRKSRVIMEVVQTFSHIEVATYYHKWQTEHSVASFVKMGSGCFLMIMFESHPKVDYDGDENAHKGVVKVTQLPNGKLEGTYFNANGQHGELTFRRTRYTLHHTFEAVGRK